MKVGESGENQPRGNEMFMGEFRHALDEKGRIVMPSRFRDGLGQQFVATRGLDRCLFAFAAAEWGNLEEKLKALPLTKSDARAFVRFLFSGATVLEFDKQGRVMLPPVLRDHAGLQKEAVVIGVGTRVEIWAKELWEPYEDEAGQAYDQIAEKIVDLGI